MRRRVMMGKSGSKNRMDIVAGDILCAKEDGSKSVFDASDYADIALTDWTPIGVVVIPPSHDVYGTGEGAAVSLKYMDYDTPDDGSIDLKYSIYLYYGQDGNDTLLDNFDHYIITNNSYEPTGYVNFAYFPSDYFSDGIQCIHDSQSYYVINPVQGSIYGPSPYLLNGSRNDVYYMPRYTGSVFAKANALSDFDGIGNTELLCSLATAQSDWRTASTIINNYESGYSPAACCCWRYHTVGTNQGDWYLPAMGELGYLIVRLKTIYNSIINITGYKYEFDRNFPVHISSTESSNNYICTSGGYGFFSVNALKSTYNRVKSFLRF